MWIEVTTVGDLADRQAERSDVQKLVLRDQLAGDLADAGITQAPKPADRRSVSPPRSAGARP